MENDFVFEFLRLIQFTKETNSIVQITWSKLDLIEEPRKDPGSITSTHAARVVLGFLVITN